ncbi:MAG: alpha-hydroxy-acid oxidizing protein [Actinophytocola sp.]|uniref:alpha-hydroxy acid oxidase n=1 Tax=Actinophytocola sp. TaxID=1872138 RepID=UPI001321142A|nr:alpha-hydroxy acid oxidase [Actinophytocola sp.]MPZ80097.1 alpha-hydroxy-acid oxidizing protein [Actinophytocola sp.]
MATSALSLVELEIEARGLLDPVTYDYFAGGADDELTARENEAAFAGLRLLPRVLRGAGTRSLEVTLLGTAAALPVLIAPTTGHRLVHPDGEAATARAAAGAGAIMTVSMLSTVAVEQVAAAGGPLWFQLYLQADRALTRALVARAEAVGCLALVVTVDASVPGRLTRDLRNDCTEQRAELDHENLRDADGRVRDLELVADLRWTDIEWLRSVTSLPIVLKGVLHPADVRLALEHGVDALVVSNHGGRQLDGVMPTIEVLPAIAEEVAGRMPLILDGGVRRGTDVVKACALGASAVAIGRPVAWGLAVDGEAGVAWVLAELRAEMDRALALCGCASPVELTPDLVVRRPR